MLLGREFSARASAHWLMKILYTLSHLPETLRQEWTFPSHRATEVVIVDQQKEVTASDMRNLLVRKFEWPEWALFWEVASYTGFAQKTKRYADGMALHMWPTRGLELHGFEIKVSRSDWLSELRKPEKSAPLMSRCHRWWAVAPSTKVVKKEELPPGWGLMTIGKYGLRIVHRAPVLTPKALDYNFMTCLVRRAFEQVQDRLGDYVHRSNLDSEFKYQYDQGYRRGQSDAHADVQGANHMLMAENSRLKGELKKIRESLNTEGEPPLLIDSQANVILEQNPKPMKES